MGTRCLVRGRPRTTGRAGGLPSGPARAGQAVDLVTVLAVLVTLGLTAVLTVVLGAVPARADAGGAPVGRLDSYSVRGGSDPSRPASTGSVEVFGWAADPDRPGGPFEVHVYADGAGRPASTGQPRPDVGAAVSFAGARAGWSAWARPGQRVCAYAIDVLGTSNTTLGCVTLPATDDDRAAGNPVGAFDEVVAAPGMLSVRGWAADEGPGETVLRVLVDGRLALTTSTGRPRPDVARAHPELGGATGWAVDLPARPGASEVCVRALNSGRTGGGHPSLGCRSVTVPGAAVPGEGDVRGALDEVTPNAPYGGQAGGLWRGWAFDGSAPSSPVTVRFRALASMWRGMGLLYTHEVVSGEPRPDVAAAFAQAGPASGFRTPSLDDPKGTTTYSLVCAYAVEVDQPAVERFLGCRSL